MKCENILYFVCASSQLTACLFLYILYSADRATQSKLSKCQSTFGEILWSFLVLFSSRCEVCPLVKTNHFVIFIPAFIDNITRGRRSHFNICEILIFKFYGTKSFRRLKTELTCVCSVEVKCHSSWVVEEFMVFMKFRMIYFNFTWNYWCKSLFYSYILHVIL